MARVFGEIPGYPEGSTFRDRLELARSGVHRPTQAGISGSQHEGADSIVLSGGYVDDRDWGDTILYTGHGGRDPETGRQVSNQMLVRQNRALALSRVRGLPIRVVRGAESEYGPKEGYRYDGLFFVEEHYREPGRDGYYVWRFLMRRLTELALPARDRARPAPRIEARTPRIVRETALAQEVKRIYRYRCQVCGTRLEGSAGPYAEAAHIRPLGAPHDGPDELANLLCLCPNHHVLFDYGGVAVADDFALIGVPGELRVEHEIARKHLRYHRDRYGFDAEVR